MPNRSPPGVAPGAACCCVASCTETGTVIVAESPEGSLTQVVSSLTATRCQHATRSYGVPFKVFSPSPLRPRSPSPPVMDSPCSSRLLCGGDPPRGGLGAGHEDLHEAAPQRRTISALEMDAPDPVSMDEPQLDDFLTEIHLSLSDGVERLPLKLTGASSGKDAALHALAPSIMGATAFPEVEGHGGGCLDHGIPGLQINPTAWHSYARPEMAVRRRHDHTEVNLERSLKCTLRGLEAGSRVEARVEFVEGDRCSGGKDLAGGLVDGSNAPLQHLAADEQGSASFDLRFSRRVFHGKSGNLRRLVKLCFEAQGERGTKRKVVSSHPFKVLSKFHDASPPGARRVVSRPSRGR